MNIFKANSNNVFNNISQIIFILDKDLEIEFINNYALDFFKISAKVTLKKILGKIKSYKDVFNESFNDILTGQKLSCSFITKNLKQKNQSLLFWNLCAVPGKNTVDNIICSGAQISELEQKQIQNGFHKANTHDKTLINTIPYAVLETDISGNIAFSNKAYEEISGYSCSEVMGKGIFYNAAYDNEKKKLVSYFNHALENQIQPETLYYKSLNKSGELVDLKIDWNYLRSGNNTIQGYLFIFTDVTLQKQAEIQIEQGEEKYLKLFKQNLNPIFIINRKGIFIDANPAALEFFEKELFELKNTNIYSFFPDDIDFGLLTKILEELYNKGGVTDIKFAINGKYKELELFISPLSINGENAVVFMCTDITERKNLEQRHDDLIKQLENALNKERVAHKKLEMSYEELETSQREIEELNFELEKALENSKIANYYKDQFIANISHEIRTPLNGIIGFNNLLLNDKTLNEKQHKYLLLMQKSGQRLMKLITDILDLSIIEAGKVTVNKKQVNIQSLFIDVENAYILEFSTKNIDFESIHNGILFIKTDENRLLQVLLNLVGNAVKFTNNGTITLSIEKNSNNYIFKVSDSGKGIAPDKLDYIFDSFVSAEDCQTKETQGAGLGLTISEKIVNTLGGKISVKSELGKGTTFKFNIPF